MSIYTFGHILFRPTIEQLCDINLFANQIIHQLDKTRPFTYDAYGRGSADRIIMMMVMMMHAYVYVCVIRGLRLGGFTSLDDDITGVDMMRDDRESRNCAPRISGSSGFFG